MEKKYWKKTCSDFVVLFLIFTSFKPTPPNFWQKLSQFRIASHLKMTNSGELMLVFRWASVNDLVQNKFSSIIHLLTSIYSIKVTDGNIRWMCKICWKLTIKTPEQSHWCHSGIFTFHSKHISHYALVFLVFLLSTLNK